MRNNEINKFRPMSEINKSNIPKLNNIDDIEIEYGKWKTTQKQLELLCVGLGTRKQYEAKNIIERWKLSSHNNLPDSEDKIKSEISEKQISFKPQIVYDKLCFGVTIRPSESQPQIHIKKYAIIDQNCVRYKDYTRRINPIRLNFLKLLGSEKDVLMCALRYSSIISGSQQWNIPNSVYSTAIVNYGVTFEGFASPFNSQVLPYICNAKNSFNDQGFESEKLFVSNPLKETHKFSFSSLFFDVDEIFGSSGDFFSYKFWVDHTTSYINPPYILGIMEKIPCVITHALDYYFENKIKGRIFITVPNWTDVKYSNIFRNSKYLEKEINFKKGEHSYEDTNDGNIKRIKATFNTILFVLSVNYDDNNDYNDISFEFTK